MFARTCFVSGPLQRPAQPDAGLPGGNRQRHPGAAEGGNQFARAGEQHQFRLARQVAGVPPVQIGLQQQIAVGGIAKTFSSSKTRSLPASSRPCS